MPTSSLPQDSTLPTPRAGLLATWLCAAIGLGCPGAQVKPPGPGRCPQEARDAMIEDLKIHTKRGYLKAVLDVRQPLDEANDFGVYQTGPLIGRTTTPAGLMPEGTLLYGYIWTSGISNIHGEDAFIGRYTQAVLPDGRKYPVCLIVGDPSGRMFKSQGSTPDTARIQREEMLIWVDRWP